MTFRNERTRTEERHLPYIELLDRVAVFEDADTVAFHRIRANLNAIIAWFNTYTGWSVQHSSECIRLVKQPARALPGHGLPWERQADARDYAMLTWILWYQEAKSADQFTITVIAKEIQERANEIVGTDYIDWNMRAHRGALRNAIACLESLSMIQLVDGDARPYVEDGSGDALYDFTPLAAQLQVRLGDTLYDALRFDRNPSAIDILPDDDNRLDYRAYRTLLLCPAVFAAEDKDVFEHIRQNRRRIADNIGHTFGWNLEVTGGYACVLRSVQDTRGRAVFPTWGGEMHVVLLLANAVRAEVAAGTLVPHSIFDTIALSRARLEQMLAGIASEYRDFWTTEFRAMPIGALLERAVATLRTWGLIDGPDQWDTVRILPALGRYAGVYRQDGAGLDTAPPSDSPEDALA